MESSLKNEKKFSKNSEFQFDSNFELPKEKQDALMFKLIPPSHQITADKIIDFLEKTLEDEKIFENEDENIIRASSLSYQFSSMSKDFSNNFKGNIFSFKNIFSFNKSVDKNLESSSEKKFVKKVNKILTQIFQGKLLNEDQVEEVFLIIYI